MIEEVNEQVRTCLICCGWRQGLLGLAAGFAWAGGQLWAGSGGMRRAGLFQFTPFLVCLPFLPCLPTCNSSMQLAAMTSAALRRGLSAEVVRRLAGNSGSLSACGYIHCPEQLKRRHHSVYQEE